MTLILPKVIVELRRVTSRLVRSDVCFSSAGGIGRWPKRKEPFCGHPPSKSLR